MRGFSQFKPSAWALIAANVLPLLGVLFWDWDAFAIVALYWVENVVIGVLCHIRAEILRDGLDGIEHVEALLRARGADPAALYVPRKQPKHFRHGRLRMAILGALVDGPLAAPQIAVVISVDLPLAAQLVPGDTITFAMCTLAEAHAVLQERRALLDAALPPRNSSPLAG